MSDVMAMSQLASYPESSMTLEEVVTAIRDEETRFVRLFHRFHELNGTTEQEDKRKKCNPLRDLKISANRAYQWAKRAGCNADEALNRAMAATMTAAETRYPSLLVPTSIEGVLTLPPSVIQYIENGYVSYTLSGKKTRKKTC